MYPPVPRFPPRIDIEDLIPWWLKGDPPPPWVIDNEAIYRKFVEIEVQYRIKELEILQQQIGMQKEKLAALHDVMAGKTK